MPFSHPLQKNLSTGRRHILEVREHRNCSCCPIRAFTLCGTVLDTGFPQLEAHSRLFDLGPHAPLFAQGDPAAFVYIVVHGSLRLTSELPDGRQAILGFAIPGDCFGITHLAHYDHGASTLTTTRLCRFPASAFRDLLLELSSLDHVLQEREEAELLAARRHVVALGRSTAMERIAGFLLEQEALERQRGPVMGAIEVRLPMSRSDIADYLGLTLETVSRTFTCLRKEGVVKLKTANRLIIRDRQALQTLAGTGVTGVPWA